MEFARTSSSSAVPAARSATAGVALALVAGACQAAGAPLRTSLTPTSAPPAVHASAAPSAPPGALALEPRGAPGDGFSASPAEREALASAVTRAAADEGYSWPRFELSLGGQLLAEVNTSLRIDSSLGDGTEFDMEDDFDVDTNVFAGRIDATWRMAERHELDFSVYDLQRSGTGTIDRDITIGDVVFPVDTEVKSEFETIVFKLAYRYAFLHRERWYGGASFGFHTLGWRMKWQATGGAGLENDFDVTAPLPVLGLFGSYALTPKLYLNAATEFFGLEYEQFNGFLNNTRLTLEHRTFSHLGFGLGLDYFMINAGVDSENGDLSAEAEHDYLGLMAFVRIF